MFAILSPAERQALKARAHGMRPVVMIGSEGLTDAVIQELDRALNAHELVKVRLLAGDRTQRGAMFEAMCQACGASPVQHIGKILVLYRKTEGSEDLAPDRTSRSRSKLIHTAMRADDAPGPKPAGRRAPVRREKPLPKGRRSRAREEGRPGVARKSLRKGGKPGPRTARRGRSR